MQLTIAIQPDELAAPDGRKQSFSEHWIRIAKANGHQVHLVNVYHPDIIEELKKCQAFMWRFSITPDEQSVVKRLLPVVEKQLGLDVFPNWNTYWHYDDKIAQTYLLNSAGIPIPDTWIFWSFEEAMQFTETTSYPVVLKLTGGAGSKNVKLIKTKEEAQVWVRDLFSAGVFALEQPELWNYKAFSLRLRKAIRFLIKGRLPNPGRWWALNKNYVLFQKFLPYNNFDTRITVIGNRAFGFRRINRPGDFRASGSGIIDWNPTEIDQSFIRLGFKTAKALGTQSVAIDGLYDNHHVVTAEVSYTYAAWAVERCSGHWVLEGEPETGQLTWQDGHQWPQDVIMEDFLIRLKSNQ